MGTVQIATQCCVMKTDDDDVCDSDGEGEKETTVVQPVPWHGGGVPGNVFLRSASMATTVVPTAS